MGESNKLLAGGGAKSFKLPVGVKLRLLEGPDPKLPAGYRPLSLHNKFAIPRLSLKNVHTSFSER